MFTILANASDDGGVRIDLGVVALVVVAVVVAVVYWRRRRAAGSRH